MKLQRTFCCITGVLIAAGFAASQASAGTKTGCDLVIEINALRGGSPTAPSNGTKDITAKARIAKGTALEGTTIDTQLQIDTIYNGLVTDTQTTGPIRLGIGKGGQGDKLTMKVPACTPGDLVSFEATFFGPDPVTGDECRGTERISKTCN
jgi:hypothetical protein